MQAAAWNRGVLKKEANVHRLLALVGVALALSAFTRNARRRACQPSINKYQMRGRNSSSWWSREICMNGSKLILFAPRNLHACVCVDKLLGAARAVARFWKFTISKTAVSNYIRFELSGTCPRHNDFEYWIRTFEHTCLCFAILRINRSSFHEIIDWRIVWRISLRDSKRSAQRQNCLMILHANRTS
jgi:hypothetical protein